LPPHYPEVHIATQDFVKVSLENIGENSAVCVVFVWGGCLRAALIWSGVRMLSDARRMATWSSLEGRGRHALHAQPPTMGRNKFVGLAAAS
jgi:hypothetical protein